MTARPPVRRAATPARLVSIGNRADNQFGADSSIVRRVLTINDRRVRVIGVLPAALRDGN